MRKRIVSISLGSKKRDKRVTIELLGQTVQIERRGTDGDLNKARSLIAELDGQVAAIGLGGIDRYIYVGEHCYVSKNAEWLATASQNTPIVDGSGLKNTLERRVVYQLNEMIGLTGKKILLVSSLDRFGMAEAMLECGADVVFGDLMFGAGLPIPIRRYQTIQRFARIMLPLALKLPISWYYPTGSKQTKREPKFSAHYMRAEILAGDFHYIRRYAPPSLPGKIVLTNTVTEGDIRELEQSGIKTLITTTPNLNGRSFGTNVMEALIVALSEKYGELTTHDYETWIDKLELKPHIQHFGPQ